MPLTQIITYDTEGNFTFSSSGIGVTGSVLQLTDQRPTGATFHISYSSTAVGNWGDGTLTGTLLNGATSTGGFLDCTDGTYALGKRHEFTATSMINPRGGAIRITFVPNYSGTPAATATLFEFANATGSTANLSRLYKDTAGAWRLHHGREDGTTISASQGFGTTNFSAGSSYEVEFNWDYSTGVHQLFVNGSQVGTTVTTAQTRSNNVTSVKYLSIGNNCNCQIKDVVLFSSPQHTASYTTGQTIPSSIYSQNGFNAMVNSGVGVTNIASFTSTGSVTGSDFIKFSFYDGINDWYLDGGLTSTTSPTSSAANSGDSIASFIASNGALDIDPNATIKLRAYLSSADGSTTPTLTSATIGYNFFAAQSATTFCTVYGYVVDGDTAPSDLATVRIQSDPNNPFFIGGNLHIVNEETTTNTAGYWALSVPETVTSNSKLDVTVDVLDSKNRPNKKKFQIQVAATTTAQVDNIIA